MNKKANNEYLAKEVQKYRMEHGYPEYEKELFEFALHFAEWGAKNLT